MAVNVTPNLTQIYDASTTNNWTSDGPSVGVISGFQREGTENLGFQVSQETAHAWKTVASTDLSNTRIYSWVRVHISLDDKVNGGIRIVLGDGTNRVAYYVGGDDDFGFQLGSWSCMVLDTANLTGMNSAVLAGTRGIVTASDDTASGNVDYHLKSSAQFQDGETITGQVSGTTATLDTGGLSSLVDGYNSDIRTMVVDRDFTGGTTSGTFIVGEGVTQANTGATGFLLEDDSGTLYVQDDTGTFNGTDQITGDTSGATNTPTATAEATSVPKDIGDGSGDLNYSGVTSANITDANPRAILAVYEWTKYQTRSEATQLEGGRGFNTEGVEGRLYRGFDPSFPEIKSAPYGTFAGGILFGAQGHFVDKDTLVAADLQNIQLTTNAGTVVNPPNLQTYQITNLQAGWRAGGYRSTGAGSIDILTTEFQVGSGNASGNSDIVVQAGTRSVSPLPADVPDTGVLRAEDPNNPGIFLRFVYDSVNRDTNTFFLQQGIGQNTIGDVTGGSGLTQGDDCFVVFIEEEATGSVVNNNIQYVSDIECVSRARKKGFLPFVAAGTFTSTGLSQGVVRTADPTVNLP